MSIQSHLQQLERKHEAIEQAIATELAHPNQDAIKIAALKRKKLFLKDEITKLKVKPVPAKDLH